MSETKHYKYPKNWFKHNLIAVPTGYAGGNCSACVFRNDEKLCDSLICTYFADDSDDIESVYWMLRGTYATLRLCPGLYDLFAKTPKNRIRAISYDIMRQAVLAKLSKTR